MRGPARLGSAIAAVLSLLCIPANAERVIATIAPSNVSISANYSGSHIVVFGAIADTPTPPRSYDAVVTVTGPRQDLIVRRKERVLGVWVNRDSSTYIGAPSYLAVSANRPFDEIANAETLRFRRIGLRHNVFLDQSVDLNDPFQTNFVNARIEEKLYVEQPRGVSFVGPTVFRAEIPLPKTALVGVYTASMVIFANGAPVAETDSTFRVEKIGLAQFVVKASVNHSLLYGLATMGLALLTGWIASVAFRRS